MNAKENLIRMHYPTKKAIDAFLTKIGEKTPKKGGYPARIEILSKYSYKEIQTFINNNK